LVSKDSIIILLFILFTVFYFTSLYPSSQVFLLSIVSVASGAQQSETSWSTGASMPTPREELSGAVLGDKIYLVGGSDDTRNGITDSVDTYDPRTNQWDSIAPIPEARDHIGVASYDGKLYAVGGFNSKDIPTDQLLIYDPRTDRWDEGKPMPTPRGALSAEFVNGTLYAIGGVDNTHNVVSINEAYDPITDTWTQKSSMPTARHHLTSSVVDGKIYAIGGRLLGNGIPRPVNEALSNFNDNEMYDPKQDKWTVLAPMPSKRSGLTSAAVNSSIYVLGGQGLDGALDNNERYDTEINGWSTEDALPTPRLGLDAAAVDGKIYAIGGKSELGNSVSGSNEIFHVNK
jgi:N-acetylneuraminic acid mutarotase